MDWLNKFSAMYILEYYAVIKSNEVDTYSVWKKVHGKLINEKVIGCSLLWNPQTVTQLNVKCIFVNSQIHLHKATHKIVNSSYP